MRIDAQVHLWEADRPDRPYPPGPPPHLSEPMTAERFLPLMAGAGIDRAIIAPPFMAGFDPSYALECAATYPDRFAITGRYDFDDPASPGRLPGWKAQPGMLGVRIGLRDPDLSRWRENGALEAFWFGVEQHGIPVSLFAPDGVTAFTQDVERHPGLKLIVDHLNLVTVPPDAWEGRVQELIALAKYPNVAVKVSALPLFSKQPYPFGDLQQPIRQVYEAFGANRLMWGSDQTMQIAHNTATYSQSAGYLEQALAGLASADDLEWIFARTLSTWLGWPY